MTEEIMKISDDDVTVTDLKLDGKNTSMTVDHPRRLLPLTSNKTAATTGSTGSSDISELDTTVLAYGGSTGLIRTLLTTDKLKNTNADQHGNDCFILDKDCLQRRWDEDEDIRAVAISKVNDETNESRIALGLDSGCTLFLLYENVNATIQEHQKHPFVVVNSDLPNGPKCRTESGPSFAAPVRDMQFHPQSSDWVVIATEEGVCMLRFQFSSDDAATYTQYFQEEATKAHDGSGVRCVCFSPDGNIVASLGMDGRLCLWYVSLIASPDEAKPHRNWTLIHRDQSRCITKRDTGEILGADAWDRSCRPYFLSNTLLVLPGETYLQFRHIHSTNNKDGKQSWSVTDQTEDTKGHIESIVTFTSVDNVNDPSHKFLISTGRDKRITMWDINLNSKSKKDNPKVQVDYLHQIAEVESAPTDLLWLPGVQQKLVVACANGAVVTFPGTKIIPPSAKVSEKILPVPVDTGKDQERNDSVISAQPTSLKEDTPENADTFFDDSDDDNVFGGDDPDDAHNIAANKKSNPFIDDEADSVSVGNNVNLSPPAKNSTDIVSSNKDGTASDSDDDMSNDQDDENDSAAVDTNLFGYPAKYDDEVATTGHRHMVAMDLPEKQPPFAPSSSPLELPRRFLCWNSIGSVTLRQSDSDDLRSNCRNTVDIHFTDSGVRRPISFTDNLGFILGSVGEDGGIFATDLVDENSDDEDDDLLDQAGITGLSEATRQAVKKSRRKQNDSNKATGSSIYFHRFETFAALREKDWYLTLPSGERALGCATGTGWAAIMTNRRFLRMFSSGGNQGHILWLNGQPITMVGRSRLLAVFYHQGEPFRDGTQSIGYKLIDALTNRVLATGPTTCISNGGTLTWTGFSNEGSLLVKDSEGMVSMLVMSSFSASLENDANNGEWVWMPVLDTLGLCKTSDDSFWPVAVYDGKLICVPLKGKVKYPDATRRPVTATLSLKLPLARSTPAAINVIEELSIRAGIALSQKKVIQQITEQDDDAFRQNYHAMSAQVDKVTLKMFNAIVDAGKLERALDLVERLHLEKSFEIAMAMADNHRKLVDFIEDVKDRRFPRDDMDYVDDDDNDNVEATTDLDLSQPNRPRISPDNGSILKRMLHDSQARHVRPKQSFH